MGFQTLAKQGCGLSDVVSDFLKIHLAKKELEQGKALKDAQANYYNAYAGYLTNTKGKTGGKGGSGMVPSTLYVDPESGTPYLVDTKHKPGESPTAMPVGGLNGSLVKPGSEKPVANPTTEKSFMDIVGAGIKNKVGGILGVPTGAPAPAAPAAASVPTFVRGPDGKLIQQ